MGRTALEEAALYKLDTREDAGLVARALPELPSPLDHLRRQAILYIFPSHITNTWLSRSACATCAGLATGLKCMLQHPCWRDAGSCCLSFLQQHLAATANGPEVASARAFCHHNLHCREQQQSLRGAHLRLVEQQAVRRPALLQQAAQERPVRAANVTDTAVAPPRVVPHDRLEGCAPSM